MCAQAFSGPLTRAEEPRTAPRLESILGRDVKTVREGDGGRVIDLLIDARGEVRAAVVEFGGFLGIGTRKIVVQWSAFRFAGDQITVDVSRDQLKAAPEYKTGTAPVVVEPGRN
jgi:predicted O-methyltransferase YrrM